MATKKVHEKGRTDSKGHWKPEKPLEYAPLFRWPVKPLETLKFLFGWGGYIWPVRVLYVALAYATWVFMHKSVVNSYHSLSISWIAPILLRNLILLIAVFGFYHLTTYIIKTEKHYGKYHPMGQAVNSKKFLFKNQVKDNMFRSIVSGVPIWSAWEILYLWLLANGKLQVNTFSSNPYWFVGFFFLIPLWREVHFYFVHRALHWKPLLRAVHSVHHKNPNCGPWSGMAMHPVEHVFYLSVCALVFFIPASPLHFFFITQLTALRPAHGHTGYEGPFFNGTWPAGDYFHYLHHKHVSCNFGESVVPLDKWFGRFYNGEGVYKTKG